MTKEQKKICDKYAAQYVESLPYLKVGISENIKSGIQPIHGLRHPQEGDTTGWYIWVGELLDDPDFFKPLCVKHLHEWCPQVVKYLGLAPGWRFLIDNKGYEDVWYDDLLLNIE